MADKKGFMGEFKEFIARGNVVDMAVGVIVGGAFKAIADSLVADIVNPLLGFISGGGDLAAWAVTLPWGAELMIGSFLNSILNFLIIAFAVFLMVKAINSMHRKKDRE